MFVISTKQPLQPIEEDITAPRIKPKEENATEKQGASNALDDASVEIQDVDDEPLSKEDEAGSVKREEAHRVYQEQLYAPVDERVDACFITRSSHYSGMINLHDIAWGNDGLWVVNSSFSCLCTLDPDYSFVPRWQPYFISELMPEDRCHLNGMAVENNMPRYVTARGTGNTPETLQDVLSPTHAPLAPPQSPVERCHGSCQPRIVVVEPDPEHRRIDRGETCRPGSTIEQVRNSATQLVQALSQAAT